MDICAIKVFNQSKYIYIKKLCVDPAHPQAPVLTLPKMSHKNNINKIKLRICIAAYSVLPRVTQRTGTYNERSRTATSQQTANRNDNEIHCHRSDSNLRPSIRDVSALLWPLGQVPPRPIWLCNDAPWAFDRMDMCAIKGFNQPINHCYDWFLFWNQRDEHSRQTALF
jgi:hypothetical protein